MLYVFQVDTGTMLTFDMNLAMESVATLHSTINSPPHSIPLNSQVLLVSGGLPLSPTLDIPVASAFPAAGTDTNPIFLFNKQNIEGGVLPNFTHTFEDVLDDFEVPEGEQASYTVLLNRAKMSMRMEEKGHEIYKHCERLIHDQHLQHLGWGAVMANLDDVVNVFKKKHEGFKRSYEEEVQSGSGLVELEEIVERLGSKIDNLRNCAVPPSISSEHSNLLTWLNSTTPTALSTLQSTYSTLTSNILDPTSISNLLHDADQVLTKAQQPQMKQIKGLSNRLYTLDQLLETCRKRKLECSELNSSIQSTTQRATQLSDASILPDLCDSHLKQLRVLKENLAQMVDIHRRCSKAKEELIANLNSRLKWVILVQKQISEIVLKLNVFNESLRKFKGLKTVIKQIDIADSVFSECLLEVGRRRAFENAYDKKLKEVKQMFGTAFDSEQEKRKTFNSKYSNHFLFESLFNELGEDYPNSLFAGFGKWREDLEEHDSPFEDEKDALLKELEQLRIKHEEDIERLRIEMKLEKERELSELREKHKSELDGMRSRVKFVGKIEEQINRTSSTEPEDEEDENVPDAVKTLSRKLNCNGRSSTKIDDTVVVYFNEKYDAFVVHGKSSSVNFIHTECSRDMIKGWVYVGRVVDKEYCVARRSGNRYRVPQGFHFYRVKVIISDKVAIS